MLKKICRFFYYCYSKAVTFFLLLLEKIGFYSFPHVIRIETTNRCNANCIMCTRDKLTRPIKVMDLDLFKKIVDECAKKKVKTLHLHNFGEPLLDPRLCDRIKYAKEKGIKLRIFSNFSVLNEELARSLIDSGIDEIKISIDGATKETYEAIRRNLDFEQVEANIEMMLRLREEMDAKAPKIKLVFVATETNEHEVNDFKKRWEDKVDKVLISSYHNWAGGLDKDGEKWTRLQPCFRIWRTFTVLCDGRVSLCCLDFDGKVILGDVNNQTIEEIYKGSKLRGIQRSHLNWDYGRIPICLDCEGRR